MKLIKYALLITIISSCTQHEKELNLDYLVINTYISWLNGKERIIAEIKLPLDSFDAGELVFDNEKINIYQSDTIQKWSKDLQFVKVYSQPMIDSILNEYNKGILKDFCIVRLSPIFYNKRSDYAVFRSETNCISSAPLKSIVWEKRENDTWTVVKVIDIPVDY